MFITAVCVLFLIIYLAQRDPWFFCFICLFFAGLYFSFVFILFFRLALCFVFEREGIQSAWARLVHGAFLPHPPRERGWSNVLAEGQGTCNNSQISYSVGPANLNYDAFNLSD